jgi:hypothetical protein
MLGEGLLGGEEKSELVGDKDPSDNGGGDG